MQPIHNLHASIRTNDLSYVHCDRRILPNDVLKLFCNLSHWHIFGILETYCKIHIYIHITFTSLNVNPAILLS